MENDISFDNLDIDLGDIEGAEVMTLRDASALPEVGASSGLSSCNSCSSCGSSSTCGSCGEGPLLEAG